ncbi:hypothetical protein Hypma_016375 [Hypsizygus marmoreus]|uniref:Fungal-type protein kinase domain-containing protein n=1 Tax=Hypsizygus marmoreus TaxID=39966 RepID=A0A369J7M2_HYPMA|nr:hypothetical protein Hypma_016375 [Hypsizygus marmoreus]
MTTPLVTHDIKEHQHCQFNTFLTYFLQQCIDKETNIASDQLLNSSLEAVLPVCNDAGISQKIEKYCEEVKLETDRYANFIDLFNSILAKLDKLQTENSGAATLESLGLRQPSKVNVLLHRNDPIPVQAQHDDDDLSSREPDIGFFPFVSVRATVVASGVVKPTLERIYAGAPKPPAEPFDWNDFLAPLEFTLRNKKLDAPPAAYVLRACEEVPYEPDVNKIPSTRPPPPPKAKEVKRPAKPQAAKPTPNAPKSFYDFFGPGRELGKVVYVGWRYEGNKGQGSTLSGTSEKKYKPDDNTPRNPPPIIQNALYGTEILCRGIYATHAITLLIVDDVVWVWWFDRQGAIQSTGINFIQDLPYFVAPLVALQRFDLKEWGIAEELVYDPAALHITGLIEVRFPQKRAIMFSHLSEIFSGFSLVGRGTRVFLAGGSFTRDGESRAGDPFKGQDLFYDRVDLVLKGYWPERTRVNEGDILTRATTIKDPRIEGHLPELVAFKDLDYSTGAIRDALGITTSKTPRVLRLLVFKRLYPLIHVEREEALPGLGNLNLTDTSTFMPLWRQCYQCHRALWEHGIKHGDISVWNLMYNPQTGLGVLNDFDLATLDDKEATDRTGTVPFMALDLLCDQYYEGKIRRRYRHDLEAFVWVLFWVIFSNTGTQEHRDLLERWNTSLYQQCYESKASFLFSPVSKYFGGRQGQREWELAEALFLWLQSRTFASGPEQADDAIFSEFEGIVDNYWVW